MSLYIQLYTLRPDCAGKLPPPQLDMSRLDIFTYILGFKDVLWKKSKARKTERECIVTPSPGMNCPVKKRVHGAPFINFSLLSPLRHCQTKSAKSWGSLRRDFFNSLVSYIEKFQRRWSLPAQECARNFSREFKFPL